MGLPECWRRSVCSKTFRRLRHPGGDVWCTKISTWAGLGLANTCRRIRSIKAIGGAEHFDANHQLSLLFVQLRGSYKTDHCVEEWTEVSIEGASDRAMA